MKVALGVLAMGAALVLSQAPAQAKEICAGMSGFAQAKCMDKEIAKLLKALDKKVFDVCAKKVKEAGSAGPAARDERLACRWERLGKIIDGVS